MRYGRWLAVIATGMLASALIGVTANLASAHGFQDEGRLLPGSTIAGVDVGEERAETALEIVNAHVERQLDTPVEIVADEGRWTTSAAELNAAPDVEAAVDEALATTQDAGLIEISWLRIQGDAADVEVEVDTNIDDAELERLIATMAEEIDEQPRDATIEWTGEQVELTDARQGKELDRGRAADLIEAAAIAGHDVDLSVDTIEPTVTTEELAPVAEQLNELVLRALDREITLTASGVERTLTPRGLGVELDLDQLRDEAQQHSGGALSTSALPEAPTDLPLEVPEASVDEVVDGLAAEIQRPARDAELDWSSGQLEIIDERTGRTLGTQQAHTRVADAIRGAAEHVELQAETTTPAVTASDFDLVLFLRLDQRTLQLTQDGEVIREWPVAVGQPSSPTPTGVFTIGHKRVEPTWTNPDPDGWGSDMPDVIGPGPDNPLGSRALNWNQDGGDTLIRFHGTNEPGSIGQAASQGCVRLTNEDVIELYDLVPRGTTIISTAG